MQIFHKDDRGNAPHGTTAQADVVAGPFRTQTALVITAHGSSTYKGQTANAGITVTILTGRHRVTDDSFEAQSSNMVFNAAASHVMVVEPGEQVPIRAEIAPMGAGGIASNQATFVELHVLGLSV